MIHLLLWHHISHAAAFEQNPLGGIWGSPALKSPHAAWWNPAMLPAHRTSLVLGGGIQMGQLNVEAPQNSQRYTGIGPMAHFGAVTQISRIRLGFSSGIPYALSGQSQSKPDYFLNSARIAIASHNLAIATALQNWTFGFGTNIYQASWQSSLRSDGLYDYAQSIRATGLLPSYTDAQLMQEAYAIDIEIDGQDHGVGFGFGLAYQSETWRFGLAGNLAPTLNMSGQTVLTFYCPPESDPMAKENAQDLGLCNQNYTGQGRHLLPLPHRFHVAAHHQKSERQTLWLAIGTVRWERYQDFELILSDFTEDPESQSFIEKPRPWARNLNPSYWIQLGTDHQFSNWISHFRIGMDSPSVPKEAMNPNNSDSLSISSMGGISHRVAMQEHQKWTIGIAANVSYRLPRQIDTSLFSLSVDEPVLESRYRWPNAEGRYTGYVAGLEAYIRYSPTSSPL